MPSEQRGFAKAKPESLSRHRPLIGRYNTVLNLIPLWRDSLSKVPDSFHNLKLFHLKISVYEKEIGFIFC